MKKIVNFLILTSIILLFISCTDDEVRAELPGVPTSLVGNIKDYHRTLNISNFTIKLSKIRGCGVSGNLTPVTCTTVVASTTSEVNGNYILNFNYNLRIDESYSILLEGDGITSRITEYVSGSNVFYSNFDASTILKGQVNALNINAWKPIKIKFNLTVLNNNTPPLNTNITYNGTSTFGTQQTYTNANTFLIGTRPNSLVNFNF